MAYFRSYFEKNNTIVKNDLVNTSKNPTTDVFYGSGHSKFIFKVDLTDLTNKVNDGELIVTTGTTHTLHLTNTVVGDLKLIGQDRGTGRSRATSFDLVLFEVPEFWDEGVGYEYEDSGLDPSTNYKTFDKRPSNWFNSTTVSGWTVSGIYTGNSVTIVDTIHFDKGNEDINVDVTDYINGIVVSGDTNYGLGLAFSYDHEQLSTDTEQSVSFFTKHTQTFFEPYVESTFDDRIDDNRQSFIEVKTNNLYLYVTKGGNYSNLDSLPTVDVLDNGNVAISGLTGLTTTLVREGIYKVSFELDSQLCTGDRFFYDVWKGLTIDGISISDVSQKFIPQPASEEYTIGTNPTETNDYIVQFSGIKQNEKIIRGEKKKVIVNLRSINTTRDELFDKVYYRLFIKEGKTNVIINDWTQMDKTNENSFYLDTSYMIPREYHMEFKAKVNTEEIFYNEYVEFEILSER